ncbi:MAG: hypothetical protein ACOYD1_07890 [Candidatus Nanopelagicales bacterium]
MIVEEAIELASELSAPDRVAFLLTLAGTFDESELDALRRAGRGEGDTDPKTAMLFRMIVGFVLIAREA